MYIVQYSTEFIKEIHLRNSSPPPNHPGGGGGGGWGGTMQLSSKYAINGKVVLSLSFEEVFNVYSLNFLFP